MSRLSAAAMREEEERVRAEIQAEQKRQEEIEWAKNKAKREAEFKQHLACWCGVIHMTGEVVVKPQTVGYCVPKGHPTNRLFVGNLPFRESQYNLERALRRMIQFHFQVHFIPNPNGGHKGTAFLSFVSADRARQAIDVLNGHVIGGRTIKAEFAHGKNSKRDVWRVEA